MSKATLKPLGMKSYGHINHIPGSRLGLGDHHCDPGQARIATENPRDAHDLIIAQEKLDGSNVGIAKVDGTILPIIRAGYVATTSPYEQHQHFAHWVYANQARFALLLHEGERVCGEWLMQAHGTRYQLPGEPFVAFDLMRGSTRAPYDATWTRCTSVHLQLPPLLHHCYGVAFSLAQALQAIAQSSAGAIDPVEGIVWRVERHGVVDFLCKYVRPEKQDGQYLPEQTGQAPVWNWRCTVCTHGGGGDTHATAR